MKIKQGFVLRQVANTNIVVPIAQNALNYQGMLSLNETGAFLWQQLEKDQTQEDLLNAILNEYDIDEVTAKKDIEDFVKSIRDIGALDE